MTYNKWIKPSLQDIKKEYKIEYTIKPLSRTGIFPTEQSFIDAVEEAEVVTVDSGLDRKIDYRSGTRTREELIDLVSTYGSWPEFRNEKTIDNLYNRFKQNEPLDMPMVLRYPDGRMRVFAGNTRMDVAFQLGVKPKVLMIDVPELDESRLTESDGIRNIIAIYPGRFQPFGPHHHKTFEWLSSKFGKGNTYIATSDKVELPKSPMRFAEKSKVIQQYGVPKSQIVQVKNPYLSKEILSNFDPQDTAVVFMYGKKDAGRLRYTKKDGTPGYFQEYKSGDELKGYEQHGYVVVAPHISIDLPGYGELSGTTMRQFIPNSTPEEFQDFFGWFDEDIYNMMRKRFGKGLNEISNGQDFVDDGPRFFYGNSNSYKKMTKSSPKLPTEFEIVDWIINGGNEPPNHGTDWPNGPVPNVSFFPAGAVYGETGGAKTMKDMIGTPAYNAWLNHIKNVIGLNDTMIDDIDADIAKTQKKPIQETIKKVGDKWVVYPKKGGKRLGTHDTKAAALKQLAAIEINKESINERVEEELDINIPSNVMTIHQAFKNAGKKLYVVGGAVRDAIIGKTPKDFDLATDAKPDEVLQIAKDNGLSTSEVGKEFGVVVVDGEEIATFREDVGKGRRPDAVNYTDIEGDVKRRDLTMNALFYDIDTGKIVDLVGGIEDLRNKRVRTVGVANERFEEDPLRKLRALRFQTRFGAEMDEEIYQSLKEDPSLKGISANRIRDELIKSIQSAQSTKQYFETMDDVGMTQYVFPNLSVDGPYIDENDYEVQLAYILRNNQPKQLPKTLNALTYTNDEKNNISFLVSMTKFTPEDVSIYKKFQDKTTLTDEQIIKFGKHIGEDFSKFVNFELSVKATDAPSDVKGKAMGDWIKNRESELYLGESINEGENLEKLGITDFKSLFKTMPSDLQKRVYDLKNIGQRADKHPEGNVLKHTITVVNRSLKDDDIDIAIAAMMHDIGKDETADIHPKKGYITHYGHEKVSAKLVKKYIDWVKEIGGNPANIYYIIKNHMRYKQLSDMRPTKQTKLKSFRAFDKLDKFGKHDMGGLDIDESLLVEYISRSDLKRLEDYADQLFAEYDIDVVLTKHFHERLNDPRNKRDITVDEMKKIFNNTLKRHGDAIERLNSGAERVVKSMSTDINMPFVFQWDDRNQEFDLVAKTVMRKPNFKSYTPFLKVDSVSMVGDLLTEGGAFGHLIHPYEEPDMTFDDLVELATRALSGELNVEGDVQEKLDGQNLNITYKDGRIGAARNKSTIKNPMTTAEVASKFEGRGGIKTAFVEAMNDLEQALEAVGVDKLNDYFANGQRFLNIEVIFPETKNVIDYGAGAYLVLLGMVEYDDKGKIVQNLPALARKLESTINRVNAQQQNTFTIIAPKLLQIAKSDDFDSKVGYYTGEIKKIASSAGLSLGAKIGDYYDTKIQEYVEENFNLDDELENALVDRWSRGIKSFRFDKNNLGDQYEKFKEIDSKTIGSVFKKIRWPIEKLVLQVGADTMSNISDFLSANPNDTVQQIRSELKTLVQQARSAKQQGNEGIYRKFVENLKRLDALGGFDRIIPSEGIVFPYKGRLMKFTGTYAPINQLLGLFRYTR